LLSLIKQDPRKIRPVFEEAVRLDSPFQYTWRTTTGQVTLGDYVLEDDKRVTAMIGAANRDPKRWPDPDRLDINRKTVGHYLGFGAGVHVCIGQMLARNEADAMLLALINRVSSIELDGEVEYHPINQLRMLERLPLRVTPA
jgi:cytochrome P450